MNYSRQREAIRECLAPRKDHPTAEKLYEELKPSMPNLSLATVYRNLALLEKSGEIVRVVCESDASDHYDPNASEHAHFYCRSCKRVLDVPLYEGNPEIARVENSLGAKVESRKIVYYGICRDCISAK